MAVSGINIQSVAQFIPKSGTQQRRQRLSNAAENPVSRSNANDAAQKSVDLSNSQSINSQSSGQATKSTLFTPVPAITKNIKSASSSRSTDQTSNRNRVQNDSNSSSNPTGRALQSFQDVADFERKDALVDLVGIDIFI